MPNSYFSFKQFTIHQNNTAMKVCTDACILGAYTQIAGAKRIIDIGTGTGLLALMLAQRAQEACIDAIEIDADAYEQAVQNVQASSFAPCLRVYHTSIQAYAPIEKYDLIIINPPFYNQYLQSGKAQQDNAWHTNTLPTSDLLEAVVRLLAPAGKVWILLPPYQMTLFIAEAQQNGLHVHQTLAIHTLPQKPVWRMIAALSFVPQMLITERLIVSETPQVYADAFKALLNPYYLNL